MSPTRWTWCSATAPATAAPWPTRSHPLPYTGAGVGYVRLEASPDPVRVRAAYVIRRGHLRHGRRGRLPARRWPMRETAWRTDEPCPVCQTGLVLVDTGGPVLRAECRLCGYAGPFDTEGTDWDGAW